MRQEPPLTSTRFCLELVFKQCATKVYIGVGNDIPYIIKFCTSLGPPSRADFLEIWETLHFWNPQDLSRPVQVLLDLLPSMKDSDKLTVFSPGRNLIGFETDVSKDFGVFIFRVKQLVTI